MRTKEYRVELTDEERVELTLLVRRGRASARVLTRAHILLAAGDDAYDADTAATLHVSAKTVERVRHRFAQAPPGERLRWALYDLARPGAERKLDAAAEAHLVALACSPPPEPRVCWTMQLLADRLVALHVVDRISDETVRKVLGEKPAQAVAAAALVRPGGRRRVRGAHGGRAGPVRRAARPGAPARVLRREAGAAPQ